MQGLGRMRDQPTDEIRCRGLPFHPRNWSRSEPAVVQELDESRPHLSGRLFYAGGMTLSVRVLEPHEAGVLSSVADGVFDGPIRADSLTDFFTESRHHIAVALGGDVVVGMATGFHYAQPDKLPELFINEVGVADACQGQGLGKRLVQALLAHARELGCVAAWVLTEEDNAAARRLYASAGGREVPGVVMSLFELE